MDSQSEILAAAFEQWGKKTLCMRAAEECGELAARASHYIRGMPESELHLAEAIADVEIICAALRRLVPDGLDVDAIKAMKLQRLSERTTEARGWRK